MDNFPYFFHKNILCDPSVGKSHGDCSNDGSHCMFSLRNIQCRGILLIWIIVGQEPTVLTVTAGEDGLDVSSLTYHFSFLSPSLWETA